MPTVMGKITNAQALILKAMNAKYPTNLTYTQVCELVGFKPTMDVFGPVTKEANDNHRKSLRFKGLVEPVSEEQPDGTNKTYWRLTRKGVDAANSFKGRKRTVRRVHPSALDPVVLRFRETRTYGFEMYTDDDLNELVSQLPEEFQDIDLELLRVQIINRRKQGAYSRRKVVWPQWYIDYRDATEFEKVADIAYGYYRYSCAINNNHKDELDVYHRYFFDEENVPVLNQEPLGCLIVLCQDCYKRSSRFMCRIPERRPI